MPKLGKNKVGLYVSLDKKVVEEFRRLISEKYGTYEKGLLSYEVEQALRAWIADHRIGSEGYTRTQIRRPNPSYKVSARFEKVKEFLKDKYRYKGTFTGRIVPLKHLEIAIQQAIGTDPRTVKKWLNLFMEHGLVKQITDKTVEIL